MQSLEASKIFFTLSTLLVLCGFMFAAARLAAAAPDTGTEITSLTYPPARRGTQVDDYHGVKVPDPYRWMEDIDSPETLKWVTAQGQLSREFLDSIAGRESMTQRLRDIWNFERWTPPVRHGANWFYAHNDGLQNQSVVFVMKDIATGDPAAGARVLLDPNTLSSDGKDMRKGDPAMGAARVLLDPNTLSSDGTV